MELFRSFRGSLFCKPVTGQELFFAVSYRKPALVLHIFFLPIPTTSLTSSDSILLGFWEEMVGGLDNLAFFPKGTSWAGDLDLEALGPPRSDKSEDDVAGVAEARRTIQLAMIKFLILLISKENFSLMNKWNESFLWQFCTNIVTHAFTNSRHVKNVKWIELDSSVFTLKVTALAALF